jgi:hypothetical protein
MQDATPAARKEPHPLVREVLVSLTEATDRSTAPAKLRLALKIGYNVGSIAHWETGRRQPCPDAVARMEAIITSHKGN